MKKPVTFAICGCGARGLQAYAIYQKMRPEEMKIVAGADLDSQRLALLHKNYNVPTEKCFLSAEELLAQPRLADVMLIATQDRQHVQQALQALEKGYHLLLEKPISPDLSECLALQKKAHEVQRNNVVDHQSVLLEFANHITATFTMTAFTQSCHRTIKITGTHGEIQGDLEENTLYVRKFGQPEQVMHLGVLENEYAGHGGGDMRMMQAVCHQISEEDSDSLTSVDASVESHVMALAAEASRLQHGKTISLSEFSAAVIS